MNNFLIFFVKQKKLALLFTLSVVILGFMTLQQIQRDTFPVIEFDRLSINTTYPSASPRDVEKNITNVIEQKIKGLYGIKEITSTSSEGSSRIKAMHNHYEITSYHHFQARNVTGSINSHEFGHVWTCA